MSRLIGIDIGTSSTKVVLIDQNLELLYDQRYDYEIQIPYANCMEQNPEIWWEGVCVCVENFSLKEEVAAIGLSGQMHGLVAVDDDGKPVRPAIIWSDSRTKDEARKISQVVDQGENEQLMYNNIATGMLLPSLLWLKENEPQNYNRIHKVMLPKDYIRYKLTGKIGTEHSDACATAAYNFITSDWDYKLIEKLGIDCSFFPSINKSTDIAGAVLLPIAEKLNLPEGVKVVFGGSDHSMQLVGNSIFSQGILNCNIGTGSQISLISNSLIADKQKRLNMFCHVVDGMYNLVGASLNGGIVFKWLTGLIEKKVSYAEIDDLAKRIPVGSDGLVFLPYLNGERCPHNEPNAKGILYGLTINHTIAHMVRAAIEGIIFCLRDSLEVFKEMGFKYSKVIASGGGANSDVLLQMQADIFDCDIYVSEIKEQAAIGAAIIAGLSVSAIESLEKVRKLLENKIVLKAKPINHNTKKYEDSFKLYQKIYKQNNNLFREI